MKTTLFFFLSLLIPVFCYPQFWGGNFESGQPQRVRSSAGDSFGNENNIDFTLSPNPNNGIFSVNVAINGMILDRITVFSVLGQIIFEQDQYPSGTTINLQNKSSGVFIVLVSHNGKNLFKLLDIQQ